PILKRLRVASEERRSARQQTNLGQVYVLSVADLGWQVLPRPDPSDFGRPGTGVGDGPGGPVKPYLVTVSHSRSAHGAAFMRASALDSEQALAAVRALSPEFAVYLGGGILRRAFIEAAGGIVINAHQGPLPEIRGMNAVEWALFLGRTPEVTIHLIDRGIDTG